MLVSAAQQLSAILQTFPRFDAQKHEIEDLRKKAADVAQNSLAMLDHAFITPLDREDILALIDGMNDVIQEIAEFSERLGLYPLETPYPNLTVKQLLDALLRNPEEYLLVEKFVPFTGSHVAQAFQQRTFAHRILIADYSGAMPRMLEV